MGIFRRLFGFGKGSRTPRRMTSWCATGEPWFDVVGESHYQSELEQICGGRTPGGAEFYCTAVLVPEPNNQFDKNAVAVFINGRKVAHMSRNDLAEYHDALRGHRLKGKPVCCQAMIVGGWSQRRGREQGHFGVKLDIEWPPEL
jgi:hypothetical protein